MRRLLAWVRRQFAAAVPTEPPAPRSVAEIDPLFVCLPDGGPCAYCRDRLEPWELHLCPVRADVLGEE